MRRMPASSRPPPMLMWGVSGPSTTGHRDDGAAASKDGAKAVAPAACIRFLRDKRRLINFSLRMTGSGLWAAFDCTPSHRRGSLRPIPMRTRATGQLLSLKCYSEAGELPSPDGQGLAVKEPTSPCPRAKPLPNDPHESAIG